MQQSKEINKYRKVLRTFLELNKLSTGHNLEENIESILRSVIKAIDCEAGSILLLQDNFKNNNLIFRYVVGPGSGVLKNRSMDPTKGIAGWVIQHRQPYICNHPQSDPIWNRDIQQLIKIDTKNILAVPLIQENKIIGAIEVINKDNSDFNQQDIEILEFLATQISIIFKNSMLYSDLEKKFNLISKMHEVNLLISSSLNPRLVMKRSMEATCEMLECERASLLLLDEKTNELYFVVALGDEEELIKEIRLKIGEGIAGKVAETGKPIIANNLEKDARHSKIVDKKTKFVTRNIICVPIKVKNRLIGVLQGLNKIGHSGFDHNDLEILISLSNLVAVAIENAQLYQKQKRLFLEFSEALAEAIEVRDKYTGGHIKRVMNYSLKIAQKLNLEQAIVERLKLGAILHDIGKIGVEDRILNKPDRLTDEEFNKMKKHTIYAEEILNKIEQLRSIIDAVKHHHERVDGKGYPDGLKGDEICTEAKIIAVCDAFDAMTTNRPYRKGLSLDEAIKRLNEGRGTQFDPVITDTFIELIKDGSIKI